MEKNIRYESNVTKQKGKAKYYRRVMDLHFLESGYISAWSYNPELKYVDPKAIISKSLGGTRDVKVTNTGKNTYRVDISNTNHKWSRK